jgi:hypothetical protein
MARILGGSGGAVLLGIFVLVVTSRLFCFPIYDSPNIIKLKLKDEAHS